MYTHWTSRGKYSKIFNSAATSDCLRISFYKEEPERLGADVEPTTDVEGTEGAREALTSEWTLIESDCTGGRSSTRAWEFTWWQFFRWVFFRLLP